MGLHTSSHTRKNSSFSTQDEHLLLLGLEALTGVSNLHYATRSRYFSIPTGKRAWPVRNPFTAPIEQHWRAQAGLQRPVARRLSAMSLNVPNVEGHPNRLPFVGCLCQCGVASTRPPSGASGHRVRIAVDVAQRALNSLAGMGVNVAPGTLQGHQPRFKIGFISDVNIVQSDLVLEGFLYAKEGFPQ
jgi:hypothetical protein